MEEMQQPVQEQEGKAPTTAVSVCDIQFRSGSKIYYFDPAGFDPKAGDHVIIDTSRGAEFGYCTAGKHTVTLREVVLPLRKVIRHATAEDEKQNEENKQKEKQAFDICLKKIEEFKLEMQLVSAEYSFDGSKILFFFTADGRVDFRELVKSLASTFRTRIELRQIGMRDKAKMVGGFGICGRPFCCGQFLDDFQPVSIKMAKTQNLSLNPTKISGTCGRLMCCLKYEQEAYEDLLRTSPKADSLVDTADGRGTVTDVNLMAQTVKVRMEKDPEEIKCYKNCDICILRNGKAKKTDAPIPEDFAPLSGNKTEVSREQYPRFERRRTAAALQAEEPVTEASAEEPAVPSRTQETAEESGKKFNNRNRHKQRGKKPAEKEQSQKQPEQKKLDLPKKQTKSEHLPKQEKQPKPEKQEPAKEQKQPEDGKQKSSRRNFHHYHRRGNKQGGKQE